MKPIYNDLKDLQVRKFVAYGKAADGKLYYEAAYTNQVSEEDVLDAFKKGMLLIVNGTEYLAPIALNGNKVTTLCKTGISSDAFDAEDTYAIGALVTKDGKVYKCTTAIQTAAAWDASKWTEVTSADCVEWLAKAAE